MPRDVQLECIARFRNLTDYVDRTTMERPVSTETRIIELARARPDSLRTEKSRDCQGTRHSRRAVGSSCRRSASTSHRGGEWNIGQVRQNRALARSGIRGRGTRESRGDVAALCRPTGARRHRNGVVGRVYSLHRGIRHRANPRFDEPGKTLRQEHGTRLDWQARPATAARFKYHFVGHVQGHRTLATYAPNRRGGFVPRRERGTKRCPEQRAYAGHGICSANGRGRSRAAPVFHLGSQGHCKDRYPARHAGRQIDCR